MRKALNGYKLESGEKLKGPDVEGLDLQLVNLGTYHFIGEARRSVARILLRILSDKV